LEGGGSCVAVMDTGGRGVATVLQGDDKEFEMVLECRGAKGGRRAFSLSIYLHWGGEGGGWGQLNRRARQGATPGIPPRRGGRERGEGEGGDENDDDDDAAGNGDDNSIKRAFEC
jgi:hypothetical protein